MHAAIVCCGAHVGLTARSPSLLESGPDAVLRYNGRMTRRRWLAVAGGAVAIGLAVAAGYVGRCGGQAKTFAARRRSSSSPPTCRRRRHAAQQSGPPRGWRRSPGPTYGYDYRRARFAPTSPCGRRIGASGRSAAGRCSSSRRRWRTDASTCRRSTAASTRSTPAPGRRSGSCAPTLRLGVPGCPEPPRLRHLHRPRARPAATRVPGRRRDRRRVRRRRRQDRVAPDDGLNESSPLVTGGARLRGDWDGTGLGARRARRGARAGSSAPAAGSRARLALGRPPSTSVTTTDASTRSTHARAASPGEHRPSRVSVAAAPSTPRRRLAYGRVFIGSTDGKVYAFGATSGRLLWSQSTGGYVYASPAVWRRLRPRRLLRPLVLRARRRHGRRALALPRERADLRLAPR